MSLRIAVLLLTGLFTCCSFNKIYLQPTKVPPQAKKLTLATATDTTFATFSSENFQPIFLTTHKDTIQFDFTIESVVFSSANGNRLNGWMIKPKNKTPDITLLHLHGNSGFIVSQYQFMLPLVKNGFQIFIFDYSGFGFSEGKATRQNVLVDAHSALSYLKYRKDVKNSKLVIYGQSLGGHLSAVLANQREAEIDGLVVEGAFSSHKDIAAKRSGFVGRLFVRERYSAREHIKKFKKPVLIIHSSEDEINPFSHGQKLFANANEPKEFYEIKHAHLFGPEFYADSISVKIKNMFTAK